MVRGMPRTDALDEGRFCTGLSSLGEITARDVNEVFTTPEVREKTDQLFSSTLIKQGDAW